MPEKTSLKPDKDVVKSVEKHITKVNWMCPNCSTINETSLFKCSCGFHVGTVEQEKYATHRKTNKERLEELERLK